ncbi:hypothetical protein [Sorangium sp. So ce542]|uniref:hypothetical protein n=1 Tax=Sorangium sp. So ce542 TaxID=3133316 RepID=UPI003F609C74
MSAGAGADQRLGIQVELLAGRVALARSQLNELALSLGRTRLQGRSLEAAFSAVATATAVMGQAAGGVLQGIATEAARTRVFVLSAFSLDGTGLKVADVGKALAKRMGVSFQTAMAAIHNGRVRVEEGLKALDDAVQAKFGKLAKAQLLGFGTQLQRTKENISALFKDVKIEPALRGLRGVLRLFDQSTVTGQQLKFIVETLLNPLFEAVARVSPYVQGFFKGLVIAALAVTLVLVRVKRAFDGAFGSDSKSKIDAVRVGVRAGVAAVVLLIASVAAFAAMIAILATPLVAPFIALGTAVLMLSLPFVVAGAAVYGLYLAVVAAYRAIAAVDFAELGARLVDGLINGIRSGISRVVSAVKELGVSATAGALERLEDRLAVEGRVREGRVLRRGRGARRREPHGRRRGRLAGARQCCNRREGLEPGTRSGHGAAGRRQHLQRQHLRREGRRRDDRSHVPRAPRGGARRRSGHRRHPARPGAGMINPLREPDPWTVVVLASRRTPGLAEVVGAGSPRDWDERKGYGISGAFLVYTGDGLAKFSVKVYLWEDAHFEEWESFKLIVDKPARGVRPKALDIYHPALDDLGSARSLSRIGPSSSRTTKPGCGSRRSSSSSFEPLYPCCRSRRAARRSSTSPLRRTTTTACSRRS